MVRNGSGHKAMNIDMTEGVIWKQLILFAIPLILGNIFQQLYNTVDSIVVGNFQGTEALAAIGATTAICNTVVNFFNGISIGAGVVISTCFGSRDDKKLHEAVETTVLFSVAAGILVAIFSVFFSPLMLRLMSTPEDVMEPATDYLRIFLAGIPVLFLYNMGSAILRAIGDTKRPLYFLIVTSVLNIVLDLVFVVGIRWGIAGAAIATVISETISALMVLTVLIRTKDNYRLVLRDLRIEPSCMKQIFIIGLPAGIQQGLTSFSNALLQSYINGFGSAALMAGWSCCFKIDQFALLPAQSIGQATTTFVSQNLGARNVKRAREGVKKALRIGFAVLVCISVLLVLSSHQLVYLFNREDPEVLYYGALFICFLAPFRFLSSSNQIYAGALRGSGDSRGPMIIMLFSFVFFRQLYLFIVTKFAYNVYTVAFGYPLGWLTCTLLSMLYYRKSSWEKIASDPAV